MNAQNYSLVRDFQIIIIHFTDLKELLYITKILKIPPRFDPKIQRRKWNNCKSSNNSLNKNVDIFLPNSRDSRIYHDYRKIIKKRNQLYSDSFIVCSIYREWRGKEGRERWMKSRDKERAAIAVAITKRNAQKRARRINLARPHPLT